MIPSDFDILVLAGRCGWPSYMLSGQMINPNESHWRSRVASARPHEREELHTKLTALAAECDRRKAPIAEIDRKNEAVRRAFRDVR